MTFRKAPIDRTVNCPDVAMLSRHDDGPHVVCSTISRFCRCRGMRWRAITSARAACSSVAQATSSVFCGTKWNAILRSSAIIVGEMQAWQPRNGLLPHSVSASSQQCGRASFATGIHRSSGFASSSNSVPSVWSAAASASLQRLCACLALPPSVPHKPPLIENRMTIVVERKSPAVPFLAPLVKPISDAPCTPARQSP